MLYVLCDIMVIIATTSSWREWGYKREYNSLLVNCAFQNIKMSLATAIICPIAITIFCVSTEVSSNVTQTIPPSCTVLQGPPGKDGRDGLPGRDGRDGL